MDRPPTVRDARPSELEQAARIVHDSFFYSRQHRYLVGATANNPGILMLGTNKSTTRLRFYYSYLRATLLVGGQMRLAVKQNVDSGDEDDEIMGILLYLPPNKQMNMSPMFLYQSGFGRVYYELGWRGYKRLSRDLEAANQKQARKVMSLERESECGHVQLLSVHPKHQGSGIGSLLLHDLDKTIVKDSNIDLILFCSKIRTRDFYVKNGFEEKAEWKMLSGIVDDEGWPIKDEQHVPKESTFLMVKSTSR